MADLENEYRYRPRNAVPNIAEIQAAEGQFVHATATFNLVYPSITLAHTADIIEAQMVFDDSGLALGKWNLRILDKCSKNPRFRQDLEEFTKLADTHDDNEAAMKGSRVALIAGIADEEPRGSARFFAGLLKMAHIPFLPYVFTPAFYLRNTTDVAYYKAMFAKHEAEYRRKQAAPPPPPPGAGTGPSTGPSTGPATGPATGPSRMTWDPEDLTDKTATWKHAWTIAEARWTAAAGSLSTADTPVATLARFRAAMTLLQESILGTAPHIPGANRQAMIDYMLTRIWATPDHMRRFLTRPNLTAITSGNRNAANQPQAIDLQDLSIIAKAFFISPSLATVAIPNAAQRGELRKIYRNLATTLHPDKNKHLPTPDSNDPTKMLYTISVNMEDSAEHLFKALQNSWDIMP